MASLYSLPLLLAIVMVVVKGEVIRPSANPNYKDAAAAAAKTKEPFTIYQTTTVFVYAQDNLTGHEWKSTFWPRIDEFSQLELSGTFNNSQSLNPNLLVSVGFNGRNTTWKHVYRTENELMIPFFTAVVLLSKGRVSDFSWQDGCSHCYSGDCLDNSCGGPRMSGSTDVCTKTDCNIKVYLAWGGRDASDNACKSIASTPNSFEQYSLTKTVNFGNGLWNDFIYSFKTGSPTPIETSASSEE